MMDWWWTLFVYFLGVLTVPVGGAIVLALQILFSKNGVGTSCHVCDHFTVDIGEGTYLGFKIKKAIHRYYWANKKWHKEAWAKHPFNRYRKTS